MDSVLPSYSDFFELECKTLKLIRNRLCLRKTLSHTADDAQKMLGKGSGRNFGFCTHWDLIYHSKDCRVFLGAIVRRESGKDRILSMSYYVCVTEGREPPTKILRKFHFDYVTEAEKKKRPHPRFHLQYGGELPPGMKNRGVTDEHIKLLLPKVREPRIFFWPMTLGLLMNTVFCEFPTEDTENIRKDSAWKNLVRRNERTILKPFYIKCAGLAGRDNAVFFDWVYV